MRLKNFWTRPNTRYDDFKGADRKWHDRGRLMYAITPRFAATVHARSTRMPQARFVSEHPDCFLQTHVSENTREVAWVKELFPERKGYLDVYDHHSLCRPRAVFGHGIHLTEDEMQTMHATGRRSRIVRRPISFWQRLFRYSACDAKGSSRAGWAGHRSPVPARLLILSHAEAGLHKAAGKTYPPERISFVRCAPLAGDRQAW